MYLLLFCLLLEIVVTALIPVSKSVFFNQLGTFSHNALYGLLFYLGVLVSLDAIQNFKPLLITLYTNIRRDLITKQYFNRGFDNETRNQRLQEDIKLFVVNQTTVYCEYFISGGIVLILIIQNYHFPFLVLSSIIYSVICCISAFLFKPKMIILEKQIQQQETTFRNMLKYAYSFDYIQNLFKDVLTINVKNAYIQFYYGLLTKFQTGIVTVLPYIYFLPKYLAKQVTLGMVMEQAAIFQLLVINIFILSTLFPKWMQAKASKERLDEL